ncbi:Hypothetical predicted protein [Podarcis lilfordi]|uniref:Uncharacterized protein n=1 Tax=Podarcis lilfordi TaxID=74358 RepID=A0AA35KH29_9SAUR|nr:Hypothetical predicted protein [Podarcis lilfordi]
MAALGALVKKVWSIRRYLVLLCTPLVLLPVLFSLPPKPPCKGASSSSSPPPLPSLP